MKNLFYFVFIVLFISCGPTQKLTIAYQYPNPFEFILIDTINEVGSTIYVRANEWMAKSYANSKSVIQMQDKEAGKIIGKGVISIPIYGRYPSAIDLGWINYVISISIKDGMYKVEITDMVHQGYTIAETIVYRNDKFYKSYGDLNKLPPIKYNPNTGRPLSHDTYYFMKNYIMDYMQELMKDFKEKMHTTETW